MKKFFKVKLNRNIRALALKAKAEALENVIHHNQCVLAELQNDFGTSHADQYSQDVERVFLMANQLQEQIAEYEAVMNLIEKVNKKNQKDGESY